MNLKKKQRDLKTLVGSHICKILTLNIKDKLKKVSRLVLFQIPRNVI